MIQSEAHSYQYDLVVIGGGSGGLATSKKAAGHGMKVGSIKIYIYKFNFL